MPYKTQLIHSLSFLINDLNCHMKFVKWLSKITQCHRLIDFNNSRKPIIIFTRKQFYFHSDDKAKIELILRNMKTEKSTNF